MQWFDPCSNLHSNSDVYMDSVTGHFVSLGNVTEALNQRVHHTKNFKMLLVGSDNLKFCVVLVFWKVNLLTEWPSEKVFCPCCSGTKVGERRPTW